MRTRFVFASGVAAAGCALSIVNAACAAEPAIAVKRLTEAGKEVPIRGFAEFDASCNLVRVQTIGVAAPPQHGTVETRPGPVVIGPNRVGGGNCIGTTLQGVNVFDVPAPCFSGSDAFSRDVGYTKRRVV